MYFTLCIFIFKYMRELLEAKAVTYLVALYINKCSFLLPDQQTSFKSLSRTLNFKSEVRQPLLCNSGNHKH